jgi:coniferyl-aldehyde dehydrogenase
MREAARGRAGPSAEERVRGLARLEKSLLGRKDAIARAIASDFGTRSKYETYAVDVLNVVTGIRYAKARIRDWMSAEERETTWLFLPSRSEVVRQPLGVVGIISPWNYPVQLALSPLVSALSAGNRAMLKPSELVPRTAELLVELVADAFADDQVKVITGGADVGEAFARLPFDHLVFTGSARVGKLVMRAASENLVPVTLELGGKSPVIVGEETDPGAAARRIMLGKTFNAGQTCVAPDYALVPTKGVSEFVRGFEAAIPKMYPTIASNPEYTAIVNARHYERLRALVDDARSRGARIIELNPGGEPLESARKIAPTLLLDVTDEMHCMQEEIFGPVLPVVTYDKLDDALAFVNDRPRPLALYYFGHDSVATDRVLEQTVSGGVCINETALHVLQDDLPFGGVGPSGMGHYHGREGFEALSKKKAVYRQSRLTATDLLRPPYGKAADRIVRFLLGR